MSYLGQALKALRPAHNFRVENGTTIIWQDDRTQPTEEEINAKIAELQAEYEANQYQRDRAMAYPSIQDQLDMQYHDQIDGTTTWKDAIAKVKSDNPKP
tara:strand:+ start:1466 stop:1762 length:297 start_codon:yes stop_codon:yes gene_type:complete